MISVINAMRKEHQTIRQLMFLHNSFKTVKKITNKIHTSEALVLLAEYSD